MQITSIFALASQQAKWLGVRQQTIAENIAHASVAGYIAKDVAPFKALVEPGTANLAATNVRHFEGTHSLDGFALTESGEDGAAVSVETEIMKTTDVRNQYALNAAIVSAFHRMILTAAKA